MNRFLADTLSVLNGVIAVVIVLTGAYLGYQSTFGGFFTVILGGALGVIVAALTCGVISYLALIEEHLAKIAGSANNNGQQWHSGTRREPTL